MPSTTNHKPDRRASGGVGEGEAANDDVDATPWLIPADVFCAQSPAVPWLVKRWVQAGSLMMAHGPSGCGKTFVVLDWCCRIASVVDDWCGAKVVTGPVVYLAGEGHQGLRGRLAAWKLHNGVDSLDMFISPEGCDLNTDDGLARVVGAIDAADTRPLLIVVDTLHRFLEGDEDKAQDARGMIAACGKLISRYGAAVMLVHHTGHAEDAQKRGRGSSSWRGALDVEISVISGKDGTIGLVQRKSKDAELAPNVSVRLQSVTLPGVFDEDGCAVSSAVVVAAESNARPGQASQEEGVTRTKGRVLMAFFDSPPSGWLTLKELQAFTKARRETVIEACDLLVAEGRLVEAPRAPNSARLFSIERPFPIPTQGVGTAGTAGGVPGEHGNSGNSGNGETSPMVEVVPGTTGNSGNDDIADAIVDLFNTPGTPAELSTVAIAKLVDRKKPDVTAAVLANRGRFTVTTTKKGDRLVSLIGDVSPAVEVPEVPEVPGAGLGNLSEPMEPMEPIGAAEAVT
jgi:hypothetical protein